jgi:hypothetical protein
MSQEEGAYRDEWEEHLSLSGIESEIRAVDSARTTNSVAERHSTHLPNSEERRRKRGKVDQRGQEPHVKSGHGEGMTHHY